MRQRRHYALAFLLVLLAAVAGAWLGLRLVQPVEMPQLDVVASLQEAVAGVDINALIPRRRPVPGLDTQPGPTVTAAPPASPAADEPASLPLPPESVTGTVAAGAEPSPIPTLVTPAGEDTPALAPVTSPSSAPSPTPAGVAFAFLPAGPVRHTPDGCPGASIRGTVWDTAGNPLPGVRLWRYDQYGNEQTVETKAGSADLGQYDFVLGDTPNVHYVQVVDVGGSPVSPRLEVQHRQGDVADAMCHTVDWISQ